MTAPVKITAKAKFDLANRIRLDTKLTQADRLIGLFIVDHINVFRGYAWCTQEQMAAGVGVTARTVRRAAKPLKKYFAIDRSGRANEYRPIGDKMSSVTPGNSGHFRPGKRTFSTKIPDTSVLPSLEILRDPLSKDKVESEEASKKANGHHSSDTEPFQKPKSLKRALYEIEFNEDEAKNYLAACKDLPPEDRALLNNPMDIKKLTLLARNTRLGASINKEAQELLGQISTEERR